MMMHVRLVALLAVPCLLCLIVAHPAPSQSRPTVVPSLPSPHPSPPSRAPSGTIAQRAQSLAGLIVFTAGALLIGWSRGARGVPWRVLIWGLVLQFAFGFIVLYAPRLLELVTEAIQKLLDFSQAGGRMVFGNLVDTTLPVTGPGKDDIAVIGKAGAFAVFAFSVLPTIIFFSALTAIAYHIGAAQRVVQWLAWVMQKTMGTSGAETLAAASNIFVGQTEAPLLVKPFLAMATRSELMAIMIGGFANIASGVLGVYTEWLAPYVRDAGGHLAAACFISAPASLVVAKLLEPERTTPETAGGVKFKVQRVDANVLDAATRGTSEGLALALNVAAMLIAFTALVAMLNAAIAWGAGKFGAHGWSFERLLGYLAAPLMWLTGVEWSDCNKAGSLLGVKTVLNEFIAYSNMKDAFATDRGYLSPRAALITTYALCGFANFASVGIQIGGISTMAPERRHDLSKIGLLAMVGGAIASLMTACVVGVLW
jgi:CNT family concentrative nucleoside transporter